MKQKLLLIGIGIVIFSGLIVYYLSNDFLATLIINLIITFPVTLMVFSLWYELWKDRIIDRWEKDPNKEKYTYLVESNKIDSGRVHFTIKVDLNGYLWRCYSKRVDWKKSSTIENLRETVMKEFLEEKREEAEELIRMTSTMVYKFQNKNEEEKKEHMKQKLLLIGIGIVILFNILVLIFLKPEFYLFNLFLIPLIILPGCSVYDIWRDNVIDEWQKDPEKEKYTYIIKSTELPDRKEWIFFEIYVNFSDFEYLCYTASKICICTERTDVDKLRETVMEEFFEKENKRLRDTKRMNTKVIYKSNLEEERNKI